MATSGTMKASPRVVSPEIVYIQVTLYGLSRSHLILKKKEARSHEIEGERARRVT